MALEQLTLLSSAPTVDGGDSDSVPPFTKGPDDTVVSVSGGGGDEGSKVPRLPRWTRQEILVLIQGKRVAENRVRRGRAAGLGFGPSGHQHQVEPKWASVSSYCKRHGVNRGTVQCRKRWSNLAGYFKKIKEWESQAGRDESESFWVMRNDLRRERKLPGFFDKEVYDILEGACLPPETTTEGAPLTPRLALALAISDDEMDHQGDRVAAAAAAVEGDAQTTTTELVFDSGRSAAAADGLFSDFEQSMPPKSPMEEDVDVPLAAAAEFVVPMPISEKQYQAFTSGRGTDQGNEKQPSKNAEFGSTSQDGRKRKRVSSEGDAEAADLQDQLIQVLEKNGKILNAQLEAQNTILKLDREERKDHASSLVAVLDKLL
ncbi:Trihelix transcription factor ASR3-like protein [Drosera capensis]